MALPPLTIKNPETLTARIERVKADALQAPPSEDGKQRYSLRINGVRVEYVVTPSVVPGRVYRLFYADGKRTRESNLRDVLLPNP